MHSTSTFEQNDRIQKEVKRSYSIPVLRTLPTMSTETGVGSPLESDGGFLGS